MLKDEKIIIIVLSVIYIPLILIELFVYLKLFKRPKLNLKKIILYNFILIGITLLSFLLLSHTNYLDYEKPIPYSNFKSIDFKNFRGLEFIKKRFMGSEHFAYVVTSIDLETDNKTITIEAFFHPSRSFVYNNKTVYSDLLSHELYHFKITEIFARKSRKEVIFTKNYSKDNIQNIIQKFKLEEEIFQRKYDYDTHHSYIYNEQIKYQNLIDSTLTRLDKFKNPKILIHEKK
ncbi:MULTISPECIES: hypothetical protein [Flavobacterium]|uniref:DUF4157 domain-containing protein n=1 Tax=Flavobacterium jumunjinense TaxID=998845 RepID=A0ABV5GTH6_9FLAO|nr:MULTISPECIES: hypothetical protein [Flavobacterium]